MTKAANGIAPQLMVCWNVTKKYSWNEAMSRAGKHKKLILSRTFNRSPR